MEANNKVQTETFPVLKGSISQLGAETGVWQDGPLQQVWMGMLCTCFSSSSQACQDQQLRVENPPKPFVSPKLSVSPAAWGSTGTGVAAGLGCSRGDGCRGGRGQPGVGLKAEAVEGQ